MEHPSNLSFCPAANRCEFVESNAPPCGSLFEHMQPLATAESVCIRALQGKLDAARQAAEDDNPAIVAETLSETAWYESECGQAAADDEEAARYFAKALETANVVIRSPYTGFRNVLSAALLHIYHPTFMARRQGEECNEQELGVIRNGLGAACDALFAAPIHAPSSTHIIEAAAAGLPHNPCLGDASARAGMAAKLIGMMLTARKGILLHPASYREGRATGSHTSQNHDAYRLVGDSKYPVKFRNKSHSRVNSNGHPGYDSNITYINMRGAINVALANLAKQDNDLYRRLVKNLGQRPDIVMVGRLLRAELDTRLDLPSSVFLDMLSANLLRELSVAEQIRLPKPRQTYLETPREIRDAHRAKELYLRYGNNNPSAAELRRLIDAMYQVEDPTIRMTCAGAYMDLARSPEILPEEAIKLVTEAQALMESLATSDWRELDPFLAELPFKSGLWGAYAEKYKKTFLGQPVGVEDEASLYTSLLRLGRKTLEPGIGLQNVRGIQFEIGVHLLNARLNVRNGKILQAMWPSLPREDSPHDFNPYYSTAWDSAVTQGAFLDQDPSHCRYLQLKGVDRGKIYDPAITVIVGADDLGTTGAEDIIDTAAAEYFGDAAATARMNTFEQRFLQKLAW